MHNIKKQAHYTIISDKIAIMLNNSENEHELVKAQLKLQSEHIFKGTAQSSDSAIFRMFRISRTQPQYL